MPGGREGIGLTPEEFRQHLLVPSDALLGAYEEELRTGRPENRRIVEDMLRPNLEELERLQNPEPQPAPERNPRNMPRTVQGPKDIAPALLQKFEEAAQRPYEPYGVRAKRAATEKAEARKRLIPRLGQRLEDILSNDELLLILADNNYAKRLLTEWGRPATPDDILKLRKSIYHEIPNVIQQVNGGQLPSFEKERINFGHPNAYFQPQDLRTVEENAGFKLAELEKLRGEEQSLLNQSSRLAPLQPSHEKAKQILESSKPSESLRLAEKEIDAAARTNIPREIGPYLAQASSSPQAFVNQYKVDYAPLIDIYRQEARKDFMEHIIPSINNKFIGAGAFNSSARRATIAKAKADKEKRIENEISKLLVHAQEEGMKHYHQHREGTLKQAEVAGHAHEAEKGSRLKAAEAFRNNAAIESPINLQNALAWSQINSIEQRNEQNKLNVAQQEQMEERERPLREVERQAALVHGVPMQSLHLSPERINPPPPNPLSFGAGALGLGLGLGMQPPQAAFKQGGQVRRGFAAGDSVARSMGQLQQLRNYGAQESPEEAEMRASAQAFKNHRANPMADFLSATGSHMLANMGEDPIRTFGQGTQLGMQAYKSAQGENLSAKEKYNNLIGKINQSKMYQHELATKYHLNQQQHEEQQRYHNATLGESKRAHDMMYGHRMEKGEPELGKPIKRSATEQKLEHDARKDLLRATNMSKKIERLSDILSDTSTSPIKGAIKSRLPLSKIDDEIDMITNNLITDIHQSMKNVPRAEAFVQRIEASKPSIRHHEQTNKTAIEMLQNVKNDILEESVLTLLSSGWTPEKIEKKFKIKIPKHLLENEIGEEDANPPETAQESPKKSLEGGIGEMVRVIGPNGKTGTIPKEALEAALQAGGKLANG